MGYFWYQKTGGEDAWIQGLSEHRERISREVKPAFVTVLDAHSSPDDGWGLEDYLKMKYSGPLYFDWDAKDLGDALRAFQGFLLHLRGIEVDLRSLRLYATGGRGFHLEVPEALLQDKPPRTGTTALPYIYRMMALDMVTDCMDLRVYSGRKGRMWRAPGVRRENGLYKVALTPEEALGMSPEDYSTLCSAPRAEPAVAAPTLNLTLAALFSRSQDQIGVRTRNHAKSQGDVELLAKFDGKPPPTLQRLMNGEGIAPNKGFQAIAMQLAIAANALGQSQAELLEQCQGLIDSHSGDSSRYGSADKRRTELARMWDYTHENPCYTYSRAAIRSLCAPGLSCADLDGVTSVSQIGMVPVDGVAQPEVTPQQSHELVASKQALLEGLSISTEGIYRTIDGNVRALSNIGLANPLVMRDPQDGLLLGLEVDVFCDGEARGKHLLPLSIFKSRSSLSEHFQGFGGVFSGSETQAGVVNLILTRAARQMGRDVYMVRREGLDLIQNPLVKDRVQREVIWASTKGVRTNDQSGIYRFQPALTPLPIFCSDIEECPVMVDTPDTRTFLHSLFAVNTPLITAQMLGWFVSCFHKQFYQAGYMQFPLLHPNGVPGSGKTMTTALFQKLFHNTTAPVHLSAGGATPFTIKAALTSSASIPLHLDEYKPSEFDPNRRDTLLRSLRAQYNQAGSSTGGISRGGALSSFRDITKFEHSTPVIYSGEYQEMQTAVMQRSVAVFFNRETSAQYEDNYYQAEAMKQLLPGLGALLLGESMHETVESRRAALDPIAARLREALPSNVGPRQIFNAAVIMEGINFLSRVLLPVFGDEFTGELETLAGTLFDKKDEVAIFTMNEGAKVLNYMFLMSRTEDEHSEFGFVEGREFVVVEGGIEVLMREAFLKYFSWCTRKGLKPLYLSDAAFIQSVGVQSYVTDKLCLGSVLKKSAQTRVFRFSLDKLVEEGVELPKARGLGN